MALTEKGNAMLETKVTRLLDEKGIQYRPLFHEKPVFTCEEAAEQRKVPLEEMVKCILLVSKDRKYFLACLTSENQVDPNKVRELVQSKRLSFATREEITEILGYELGAIPPLLPKNAVPVVFDKKILEKSKVNISSGNPNAGIELDPKSLAGLINPIVGEIAK